MQRVNTKAIIAVVIIIALLGGLWIFRGGMMRDEPVIEQSSEDRSMMIRARAAQAAGIIRVLSPQPNTQVAEPLVVTGVAHPDWYDDDMFRVELHDKQGVIIGTALAQASGESTADGFIPFTASINYSKPVAGSVGKLLFRRTNPSGNPAEDLEYTQSVYY